MTELEYEYGPEWKIIEWSVKTVPQSIGKFLEKYGPSNDEINKLYNNFNSLTESLNPENEIESAIQEKIVEKIEQAYHNVTGYKRGRAEGFIKRGTTYHNMKSIIENAKDNKTASMKHKLHALGYNSLVVPKFCYEFVTMLYSVPVAFGVLAPIDFTRRVIKAPNKMERICNGIKNFRKEVSDYREIRQENERISEEMKSRFYEIVDDKI
jgi:hypothetical protein